MRRRRRLLHRLMAKARIVAPKPLVMKEDSADAMYVVSVSPSASSSWAAVSTVSRTTRASSSVLVPLCAAAVEGAAVSVLVDALQEGRPVEDSGTPAVDALPGRTVVSGLAESRVVVVLS